MIQIDYSQLGGLPLTQDHLKFLLDGYLLPFQAMAALIGDNVIVSGVVVTGADASDGWVVIDGELMPFVGGAVAATITVIETVESELFADAVTRNIYTKKHATFSVSGVLPFADFTRVGTLKNMFYSLCPKDTVVSYVGLVADIPTGWELFTLTRGRVIVGYDERLVGADADFNAIGNTGGVKENALNPVNIPPLTVAIPGQRGGDNNDHSNTTRVAGGDKGVGESAFHFTLNATTAGGATPVNNLQPYYVTGFIKKVI